MQKLLEVQTAKLLMTEAIHWSVMKWLREKKRVRTTADEANAALDEMRRLVAVEWDADVKAAYGTLSNTNGAEKAAAQTNGEAGRLAAHIKQADDEARRARMDAEEAFDQAERQLSTSLAREGCRKAIRSWELHEEAIRIAESAVAGKN
jgi:hypothetical protein